MAETHCADARIDTSAATPACSDEGCSCSTAAQSPFSEHAGHGESASGLARWNKLLQPARMLAALLLLGLGVYLEERAGAGLVWSVYIAGYLLVGWPVLLGAARNILRGRVFDELFLMTIATIGAFAIGELPEAVAVMLFYSLGEYFQDLAVDRSRRSIAGLMDLRPDTARVVLENRATEELAPERVEIGQTVQVLPGERIPLDGTITEGEGRADTSALTGESVPRMLQAGDAVAAGWINGTGRLHVRVERRFSESSVVRILQLVQHSAEHKAPTERFISRFARIYTPVVVAIATAMALLPPLLFGLDFSEWLYRGLVVLVISCPCALVVSIPLGYFGGIGGASRRRVLVKGANYLDALHDVHTVVFDKTGTLTQGVFTVTAVEPCGGYTAAELLRLAALAESGSSHPIARSIRDYWQGQGNPLEHAAVTELREEKGFGVFAVIDGTPVIAGSHRLMHREGIPHEDCGVAGTAVFVAVDGAYAGYLIVSDRLKPEAASAVARLHGLGVERVAMCTGDARAIAEDIAAQIGIDEVHSELLPEDKVALVERLQDELPPGRRLAFVGDGMNDAPVLMRADVGIAMGGLGSDAAIEAADVVLMDDTVDRAAAAIEVGHSTRRIVRQNIVGTLMAKGVFIALGAAGFVGMWAAVIGDVGVALLAVANSTRTLRVRGSCAPGKPGNN